MGDTDAVSVTSIAKLTSMINPELFPPGTSLENSIDAATLWLCTAKSREQRKAAIAVLEALVKLRSDERVKEMESERGLAR